RARSGQRSASLLRVYAAPRSLPSFPTRRSSDLEQPGRLRPGAPARRLARRARRVERVHAALGGGAHPLRARRRRARGTARRGAPDRKSTRLNSSHVKISYAVFCLKKKTLIRSPL